MIEEAYVSFEVAKLLKEKGFDESCWLKYDNEGYLSFNHVGYINSEEACDDFCALAPTHQMAMAWLREVHKLHIGIARGPKGYHITIETIPLGVVKYITREIVGTTYVDSYEDAVEASLKYILENLI